MQKSVQKSGHTHAGSHGGCEITAAVWYFTLDKCLSPLTHVTRTCCHSVINYTVRNEVNTCLSESLHEVVLSCSVENSSPFITL